MTPEHDSRLQNAEAMESFFLGKSLLFPSPSDLSYYNHYTQHASYSSSPTFEVSARFRPLLPFTYTRSKLTKCHLQCGSVRSLCITADKAHASLNWGKALDQQLQAPETLYPFSHGEL